MAQTRTLTAAAVERIRAPRSGQTDHFDQGYPGLALRVSYGGARTWVYFYRLFGKQKRMTLGRWPSMSLAAAREAWRDARKTIDKGESPQHQRPAAADSFAAVADEWIKRDQAHNRSCAATERLIDRCAKPVWEGRQISTIGRRDINDLIDSVADRGAIVMARRLHAHLHRLFRWAVGRGILETNPMAHLPKPGSEVPCDRVLTDPELAQVFKNTTKLRPPFGPIFQLLILTGARRGEITGLRWSEIVDARSDLPHEQMQIELSGSRTKNGKPHIIPLSPPALAILKELARIGPSDFVFTINGRNPVTDLAASKERLDGLINIPAWRTHDLRRTVATGLQRLGINLQVIEAVLGHVGGSRSGIVGVYQRHSFDAEKHTALEAWAREVERIVDGKPAKVLPLRRR
jgi:integrase